MAIEAKALETLKAMRTQAEINSEGNTDEQALEVAVLYPDWESMKEGTTLKVGSRVNYMGILYNVIQTHDKQELWNPVNATSLFAKVLIPDPETIPDWEQPGPENAYKKGDKVRHNEKIWESQVENNVWEPGAVGTEAQWAEVIE